MSLPYDSEYKTDEDRHRNYDDTTYLITHIEGSCPKTEEISDLVLEGRRIIQDITAIDEYYYNYPIEELYSYLDKLDFNDQNDFLKRLLLETENITICEKALSYLSEKVSDEDKLAKRFDEIEDANFRNILISLEASKGFDIDMLFGCGNVIEFLKFNPEVMHYFTYFFLKNKERFPFNKIEQLYGNFESIEDFFEDTEFFDEIMSQLDSYIKDGSINLIELGKYLCFSEDSNERYEDNFYSFIKRYHYEEEFVDELLRGCPDCVNGEYYNAAEILGCTPKHVLEDNLTLVTQRLECNPRALFHFVGYFLDESSDPFFKACNFAEKNGFKDIFISDFERLDSELLFGIMQFNAGDFLEEAQIPSSISSYSDFIQAYSLYDFVEAAERYGIGRVVKDKISSALKYLDFNDDIDGIEDYLLDKSIENFEYLESKYAEEENIDETIDNNSYETFETEENDTSKDQHIKIYLTEEDCDDYDLEEDNEDDIDTVYEDDDRED